MLMLAVAVTAYANTVRAKVPVYGEEAERAWDQTIANSFLEVKRAVTEGMESGAPASATVPMPPLPRTIDLPFLGSVAPYPPSGSVRFEPGCAAASATHTLTSGTTVTDLTGGAGGCVAFAATPVYSLPFGYSYELGGVLRLQAGKAVVLAGPPLELDASTPSEYRVSVSLPGLRGNAIGVSTDASNVHVDVVPGPAAAEVEQAPNAAHASWAFDTANPGAWKTWLSSRFTQAGFVAARASPAPGESSADFSVNCVPADAEGNCLTSGGIGRVNVEIEGPRTDAADLKLSITYGIADVNLR